MALTPRTKAVPAAPAQPPSPAASTVDRPVVLKSVHSHIALQIAHAPGEVVLVHRMYGPVTLETFRRSREFDQEWKVVDYIDPIYCARRLLAGEPNLPPQTFGIGAEEALLRLMGHDVQTPTKVEKTERKAERANQPSSKARAILRETGFDAKSYYARCVAEGIDKKLAASVLCIERKKAKTK
jgi:hypothetical protein